MYRLDTHRPDEKSDNYLDNYRWLSCHLCDQLRLDEFL